MGEICHTFPNTTRPTAPFAVRLEPWRKTYQVPPGRRLLAVVTATGEPQLKVSYSSWYRTYRCKAPAGCTVTIRMDDKLVEELPALPRKWDGWLGILACFVGIPMLLGVLLGLARVSCDSDETEKHRHELFEQHQQGEAAVAQNPDDDDNSDANALKRQEAAPMNSMNSLTDPYTPRNYPRDVHGHMDR